MATDGSIYVKRNVKAGWVLTPAHCRNTTPGNRAHCSTTHSRVFARVPVHGANTPRRPRYRDGTRKSRATAVHSSDTVCVCSRACVCARAWWCGAAWACRYLFVTDNCEAIVADLNKLIGGGRDDNNGVVGGAGRLYVEKRRR